MKWQNIRWKAIEKYVFNLQKKIYQASLNDKKSDVNFRRSCMMGDYHVQF